MAPGPHDADRDPALRARRGDRRALEVLYENHKGRLFGFVNRLVGGRDLAKDVFQDVWLKVMNTVRQYDPDRGPFQAWLYRVASNCAIDRLRAEAARGRRFQAESAGEGPSILDATPAAGPDPERRYQGVETERRIRAALTSLDPRQRCAVLLRHQIGLSYREIASMLGVPEGTAKTLVHRGVLAVRGLLGKETP